MARGDKMMQKLRLGEVESHLRRDNRFHDYDESDEETYFTYRPLSNLPTPPPSSRNSSADTSPKDVSDGDEPLEGQFLGPSIHLVNLIPPSVSLTTPSVPLVQAMLGRAGLPLETVALAVCILDSLDSKFALGWRLQYPLDTLTAAAGKRTHTRNHTLAHSPLVAANGPHRHHAAQLLHIDSVHPEVIILAALVIAVKFTNDLQDPTHHYCETWGRGLWTYEQLNVTERCIMENLGYRIMPLCDEELLVDAMVDMQLAARQRPVVVRSAVRCAGAAAVAPGIRSENDDSRGHRKGKSMGTAVLGLGLQPTPVETPTATEDICDENVYGLRMGGMRSLSAFDGTAAREGFARPPKGVAEQDAVLST